MDFRTTIKLEKDAFSINQNHKILLLGSCFAEEIGCHLQSDKFSCDVNPFGVLYNPYSICQAIEFILSAKLFTKQDLFYTDGLWHSWMHHGSFSRANEEECLRLINDRLLASRQYLFQSDLIIITLGSNRCFRYKKTGEIVGNCHKVAEREFEVCDMGLDQINTLFSSTLKKVFEVNQNVKIIFTVSPIRYLKYGLHESMIGKSTLLLAIEKLQNSFKGNVHYFPAFEIQVDDLRDYRFYAEDMVHPSTIAVDYIYQCFKNCYFDREAVNFATEWRAIEKALNHKPFYPSSPNYKLFIENTKNKIEQIHQKYPTISVEKEWNLCTTILNKLQQL